MIPGTLNRLQHEKSPYLLQHAANPVDWYPWGEEAFTRAKNEDKPVFLSIGYSTCHWCHVMARESFEDDRTASLLNEAFVCVKVDREERPDIDGIYMQVCQMMTGGGGWPLTVVMTPERRPFFAATYIPKESRWGRTGLIELIPQIGRQWRTARERIEEAADRVVSFLQDTVSGSQRGE
ncbi:MAG: thioredoxin domain-containing protein, partial [Deltaproteobacteria bacterium]|nr:thioredoxin domain-containing protein [Deltaproteobacteria bacterium]